MSDSETAILGFKTAAFNRSATPPLLSLPAGVGASQSELVLSGWNEGARPAIHSARSEAATGRRAARIAGGKPPSSPINRAKTIPPISSPVVILKANAK